MYKAIDTHSDLSILSIILTFFVTGLFVYTSGNAIIIEDLNNSGQKHLTGHVEEISTLALQNDCQVCSI